MHEMESRFHEKIVHEKMVQSNLKFSQINEKIVHEEMVRSN